MRKTVQRTIRPKYGHIQNTKMNIGSIIKYRIGIDEVGRGPIAGPVAVGALVIFDEKSVKKIFCGVKESKQLTEQKREMWFAKIQAAQKAGALDFQVTFKSHTFIDTKGLSFAIKCALAESLEKLCLGDKQAKVRVLLDGGLKAPTHYTDQKTIIKGDEKEMIIALASICAKVLRDRKMNLLAKKYPQYGFEKHKGYGTRVHYEAIREFGLLDIHRRSFLKKFVATTTVEQ